MMRLIIGYALVLLLALNTHAQGITIMIDPGHGGSDPGHESIDKNHLPEKDLNLKIAQKFGNYLTERLQNVTVLYTRTEDKYISLDDRVEMANSKNVHYFVSIHINGSPNKNIRGTETHVHSLKSKKAVRLARIFEEEFKNKAGRKSRGVKDTDDREHSLQVLKFTKMTSVLVECGFITNTAEANYLNTTYGQDIIASALFRGMRTFLQETHPGIEFVKNEANDSKAIQPNSTASKEGKYYSVQIMSSKEWIDTESEKFKKLKHAVERSQVAQTGYKYKYFSGNFKDKSAAESYQKEVQKQGFPDAIIVERSN